MTDSAANHWTVARLLDLFDVEAESQDRYIAPTGIADATSGRSSRAPRFSPR